MKPPFAYYGGKTALADRIVRLLPAHRHYVEPFAGGLAILLAKPRSYMETVNDLDGGLMTFWRVLRDRPADLVRVCAMTPHSRAEYTAAYEPVPDDHPDPDLEHARRVWTVLAQGRAGTLLRTGWRHHINVVATAGCPMPGFLAGYVERMTAVAERLRAVSLECRPALEAITAYGADADTLLYVDPPYLAATRTSTQYRHEMPHEADHRELAATLHEARAAVVLSGYESPLYSELYGGWHRTELAAFTVQGGSRGARTEVLWSNRPFPVADGLFEMAEVTA